MPYALMWMKSFEWLSRCLMNCGPKIATPAACSLNDARGGRFGLLPFHANLLCDTRTCFASSPEMTSVGGHHVICFAKHWRLGREKLGSIEHDQIVANCSRYQMVQICSFSNQAS